MCAFFALGFGVAATAAPFPMLAAQKAGIFKWRPFLGPFHSLVLHYPIGFLTLAAILDVYRRFRPNTDLRAVVRLVVWLSLITGLAAAGLGLLRASSGGYEGQAVSLHRWSGLAVPAATLLILIFQKGAFRPDAGVGIRWAYGASLATGLVLLVIAGHYGGNLTHGSKYLVQNAPVFVKRWLAEQGENVGDADPTSERQHFKDTVRPLLEAKCISCHGPEKQKGKYRLDQRALALAAGSTGRAGIKPGEPLASELIRRVVLPAAHDDAMPPDGKGPLTDGEILELVRWIQAGAPYAGEPALTPSSTPTTTTGATNRTNP